jgi:hypothetical protein
MELYTVAENDANPGNPSEPPKPSPGPTKPKPRPFPEEPPKPRPRSSPELPRRPAGNTGSVTRTHGHGRRT